jgi:hypothetical protein
MALTKKQAEVAALVFEGKLKRQQIADKVGIAESTLYKWQKLPEFEQAVVEAGHEFLRSKLGILVKNAYKLALDSRSEMVRFQATTWLLDRAAFGIDRQQDLDLQDARIAELEAKINKLSGGDENAQADTIAAFNEAAAANAISQTQEARADTSVD